MAAEWKEESKDVTPNGINHILFKVGTREVREVDYPERKMDKDLISEAMGGLEGGWIIIDTTLAQFDMHTVFGSSTLAGGFIRKLANHEWEKPIVVIVNPIHYQARIALTLIPPSIREFVIVVFSKDEGRKKLEEAFTKLDSK